MVLRRVTLDSTPTRVLVRHNPRRSGATSDRTRDVTGVREEPRVKTRFRVPGKFLRLPYTCKTFVKQSGPSTNLRGF